MMEEVCTQAAGSNAGAEQDNDRESEAAIQGENCGQHTAHPIPAMRGPFHLVENIKPRPLEWIWKGMIPRGKLTLVIGEPGVGKSLFALHIAAMVTRRLGQQASELGDTCVTADTADTTGTTGTNAVDPAEGPPPGVVLIFSTDDTSADTVRPRLEAADADVSRVFFMSSDFIPVKRAPYTRLPIFGKELRSIRYLEQLDECLKAFEQHKVEVSLIIIDPIDSFLSCIKKEHDLADKVTRLVDTAARTGAAIVMLANSNSTGFGRMAYRSVTRGNEELANAARSVLLIAPSLEQEDQRLVLPVKLNLSETSPAWAFTIQDQAITLNPEPVSTTFEEYFTQTQQKSVEPPAKSRASESQRAMNWLKEKLSHGPVARNSIFADADELAITDITLRRAFRKLNGVSKKATSGGQRVWQLPTETTDTAELQASLCSNDQSDDHGLSHEITGDDQLINGSSAN